MTEAGDSTEVFSEEAGRGAIIRSILRMGVPSMIGFAFGNLYDLADAFWLSRMGAEAVAAVTILAPFLWVMHSANMIVGAGSVAVISRRYGERDLLRTELAIRETIILKWIVALIFGLIGFLVTPWVIRLLGAEGEAARMGSVYGRIIFIGLGFNFSTYSVFTALRGVNNPNRAMILMLGFTALNIVLDPLFIFGWGFFPAMGVAGAAWASILSYAVAFTAGMIMLCGGKANLRLRLKSEHKIQWPLMMQILKIGAPSAISAASFSTGRTVVMPLIAAFGMETVAAYGVATRISSFGVLLLVGIGLGLSALIGHVVGSGQRERARRTADQAILVGVGIMVVFGLLVILAAGPIMRRFFDDPAIARTGVELLRILAAGFPFMGLFMMLENIYTGVGENRPAMFTGILQAWALEVPAVFLCAKVFHLGPHAVWTAIVGANAVAALVFYAYFRKGRWLDVSL